MPYRGVVHDAQSPTQLSCGSGDQASYVHSDQLRAAPRDENSEGPSHQQKYPEYPDKTYYMSAIGKYLFRHEELRHLRVEQVNRYFAYAGTGDNEGGEEYLWGDANDNIAPQVDHRHYDEYAQELDIGKLMASNAGGVPGLRRRKSARLGISRVPFHEPIGSRREAFYEQKLLRD